MSKPKLGPANLRPQLRELLQEADVVLEKDLDVVDPVFEHGQTIDTDAEGEAADLFRVVVHKAEDGGIDHTGTEQFNPARAFAFAADAAGFGGARTAAEDTGGVEFDRRLGEREIAGAEARADASAEEFLDEVINGAGEIAEGNVAVDGQSFDLMEHEGMGGIGIVAA